jgi:HSP20 family protein
MAWPLHMAFAGNRSTTCMRPDAHLNHQENIMAITQYTLRNPRLSARSNLEDVSNRLARFFDEATTSGATTSGRSAGFAPVVSVTENKNELALAAELPGLSESDVSIDLENSVLTISGEKAEVRTEGEEDLKYHVAERRWGSFKRSFQLPRTVKSEDISARFENGLLTVVLPKAPEAQGRKIEIAKD